MSNNSIESKLGELKEKLEKLLEQKSTMELLQPEDCSKELAKIKQEINKIIEKIEELNKLKEQQKRKQIEDLVDNHYKQYLEVVYGLYENNPNQNISGHTNKSAQDKIEPLIDVINPIINELNVDFKPNKDESEKDESKTTHDPSV